ncbi:XRE family transcriptional regulator [Clostridium sp. AWRP]|uniref:helix-turn-helix domain-containing protein n=1 Tax=Clostridium sp. AWRP TaxID=2212991 RepID=UPI000FD90BEA|nr:XRE family transcriptional regulator [Clostridium sp. AWRP]AZV56201.1 cupin domain-containing protein [Clostridium sp. AWRP]
MKFGFKIRKLRQEKSISIEQLAEMAKLSTGLISQVERNITGPSVTTLWKIAKALNVSMNYFFDEDECEEKDNVVRKDKRKMIILPNSKITYELLSPNIKGKIEYLLVEIDAGECNTKDLICHEGEECGYIIKGTLKVKLGNKEYILEEGDSIYFNSNVPHRYINAGNEKVISIWAMTPPSF